MQVKDSMSADVEVGGRKDALRRVEEHMATTKRRHVRVIDGLQWGGSGSLPMRSASLPGLGPVAVVGFSLTVFRGEPTRLVESVRRSDESRPDGRNRGADGAQRRR